MYFFAPFFLLSFSSVVQAASTPARPGLSLPLTRRSELHTSEGAVHVDSENLRRHVHHAARKFGRAAGAGAIPPFPLGKRGSLGDHVASEPLTPLSPLSNLYTWTCKMKIGATTFNLLPSTGNADLVVPGIGCTDCGNVTQLYDPKKSHGKDLHRKVNEVYDSGSSNVTGKLYEDTVSIAGLTAKHQKFVAASDQSESHNRSRSLMGIFGLAYPRLSPIKATPPFQTLIEQKQIDHAVFGVSYAPNCSELHLGGINPKYSDKDFANFKVLGKEHNPGHWMVNMTSVSVGGVGAIGPKSAIVDTGTSFMLVSNRTAGNFYKHVAGSTYYKDGFYLIPCDFGKNVTITFSGDTKGFSLRPHDFALLTMGANSHTHCLGTIVGTAVPDDTMVLGDVFLRQFYTKFDFEKNQVGFAALRKC